MKRDTAKEFDALAEAYERAARSLRLAASALRDVDALKIPLKASAEANSLIRSAREDVFNQVRAEAPEDFARLSYGDAAYKYLSSVSHPVPKEVLAAELEKRGVELGSMDALGVALSRHREIFFVRGRGWSTSRSMFSGLRETIQTHKTQWPSP